MKHLTNCLHQSSNPIIKNDLYYFLQRKKIAQIPEESNLLTQICGHVKQELHNLLKIIPGKPFNWREPEKIESAEDAESETENEEGKAEWNSKEQDKW